jgi:hypothetical protein
MASAGGMNALRHPVADSPAVSRLHVLSFTYVQPMQAARSILVLAIVALFIIITISDLMISGMS